MLEVIKRFAFSECTILWRVVFERPSSLRIIEDMAFAHTSLIELEIPQSVEVLGPACFHGVITLTSLVSNPDCAIAEIGEGALS